MPTGRLCISLTTRRQTTATLFPYTTLFRSIFPDEILRFARNGAELFVNISDDAWYGDYGAPGQHLNMARMRAVENGRWLVRATNNGITSSITPLGQVVAAAPRNTRTVLQAPYAFELGTTFYTRHGDWFASTCAIISLLALIIAAAGGRAITRGSLQDRALRHQN